MKLEFYRKVFNEKILLYPLVTIKCKFIKKHVGLILFPDPEELLLNWHEPQKINYIEFYV